MPELLGADKADGAGNAGCWVWGAVRIGSRRRDFSSPR